MNGKNQYDIAIIGGGILGCSIAYLLSYYSKPSTRMVLIEQESSAAFHASSRNTGKVHAPFLYDPSKKKLFAEAAALGFQMLFDYCRSRHLPFVRDGVMQVATNEKGIDHLHRYIDWGHANGLSDQEIKFLDSQEVREIEPNVRCKGAIHCTRDASVDYRRITQCLLDDARLLGCEVILGTKLVSIVVSGEQLTDLQSGVKIGNRATESTPAQKFQLRLLRKRNIEPESGSANQKNFSHPLLDGIGDNGGIGNQRIKDEEGLFPGFLSADYLINVAGGAALPIAQSMNLAKAYQSLHFRGEYWVAPQVFKDLTKMSIYSVPKYPEYPFLDPHWIVRVNGKREIGPNAVMVYGPYAYNWKQNIRLVLPKFLESIKDGKRASGFLNLFTDKKFVSLSIHELQSSISKRVMINRTKQFLPALDPSLFTERGTSGIRSSLINKYGRFVPDIFIIGNDDSTHVLNYNSPGATGSLPIAAMIVNQLLARGVVKSSPQAASAGVASSHDPGPVSIWNINQIGEVLSK